jgi:hypothetical protein
MPILLRKNTEIGSNFAAKKFGTTVFYVKKEGKICLRDRQTYSVYSDGNE